MGPGPVPQAGVAWHQPPPRQDLEAGYASAPSGPVAIPIPPNAGWEEGHVVAELVVRTPQQQAKQA